MQQDSHIYDSCIGIWEGVSGTSEALYWVEVQAPGQVQPSCLPPAQDLAKLMAQGMTLTLQAQILAEMLLM